MPLPVPKKEENEKAFISRCLSSKIMTKEYKDAKQRSAVCYSQWRNKTNMHINSTITNVQSKPAQWLGKDYIVVPVIMAVEGVHNGSVGPLLYPEDEIKATAEAWSGVPVTVQHPVNKDGQYTLAASEPQFIIGHIAEAIWDDKLRAEAWIDIEKANAISTEIMTIIRGNGQLEVSTGLMSEDEITKGDWKGEAYAAIVRNITPDHLALLPGGEGACNWADGCGIRANKEGDEKMLFKGFDLSELKDAKGKDIPLNVLSAYTANEISHGDVRRQIQSEINAKDNQNQYHFVRDVFDKFFVYSKEQDGQKLQLFKQGYNLAANDEVEMVGDVIEVIEKTDYINVNTKKEDTKMDDKKKEVLIEKVKALITNEKSNYTDEDQKWLEGMEEEQLDKLIANVGITEDAEKSLVTAAVEKAFNEAIHSGEMIKVEKKDPDKKKPPTVDDFIANAPAEMQDVLQSGLDMHREKKVTLVGQILINEQNKFTKEELEAKGVGELMNIAALIPLQKVEDDNPMASYAANSAGDPGANKEEPMEMPAMEAKK